MKAFRYISSVSRKGLLLTIGVLLALASAFTFSPGIARAEAPVPQPYDNYSLANSLKKTNKSLVAQQTNLATANNIVAILQNLITVADSQGISTTDISSAVTTFQAQLVTATSSNMIAANILAIHKGFNNSGQVTDPVAATQTISQATQALKAAHLVLQQATKALYTPVGTWGKTNPIIKQIDTLQQAYANEKDWLNDQKTDLVKTGTIVTDVQNLITLAHSKGKATTNLTKGLTSFQAQLINAQSAYTTAETFLSAHNGFDDTGNVTDVAAATLTAQNANNYLGEVRAILAGASGDLLRIVNNWQVNKNITSTSPIYATLSQAQSAINNLRNSARAEDGAHAILILTRLGNLLQAITKEL